MISNQLATQIIQTALNLITSVIFTKDDTTTTTYTTFTKSSYDDTTNSKIVCLIEITATETADYISYELKGSYSYIKGDCAISVNVDDVITIKLECFYDFTA